jgi:hypothetical protein
MPLFILRGSSEDCDVSSMALSNDAPKLENEGEFDLISHHKQLCYVGGTTQDKRKPLSYMDLRNYTCKDLHLTECPSYAAVTWQP